MTMNDFQLEKDFSFNKSLNQLNSYSNSLKRKPAQFGQVSRYLTFMKNDTC